MLNGRADGNNDFTCVSKRGRSVVDYVFTPHEQRKLKQGFCNIRNQFDKLNRNTKRNFQLKEQDNLTKLFQSNNTRDFWKYIGNIGIANERRQNIPFKVKTDEGFSSDVDVVLDKWKTDYEKLFNSGDNGNFDNNHLDWVKGNNHVFPTRNCDTLNCPVTRQDVIDAVNRTKLNKAVGFDYIPAENSSDDDDNEDTDDISRSDRQEHFDHLSNRFLCYAHSLQLVVRDGIQQTNQHLKNVVLKASQIISHIRKSINASATLDNNPIVILEEETYTVVEGQPVNIKCITFGNPTPDALWIKLKNRHTIIEGGQELNLTIPDIDREKKVDMNAKQFQSL
ncbi:unnamed protein product [Mytilus edulis]|uniref:Ig-like domain-containing protein n=1 Tax=Mytilus edulis TaxID=6550 RepID=A0A8S3SNG6_MYTED|nr:unnamed protein product [Mytilus edulis]